ncbi:MAG TPA: hypothetical protein VK612_11790 [Pyrinomonadaceae bacterium]|nr:hypothetical protein [Pyrinomonadaceae bacterium]
MLIQLQPLICRLSSHLCGIKKIAGLSAKEAIIKGFLDGSYGRYLLGD